MLGAQSASRSNIICKTIKDKEVWIQQNESSLLVNPLTPKLVPTKANRRDLEREAKMEKMDQGMKGGRLINGSGV